MANKGMNSLFGLLLPMFSAVVASLFCAFVLLSSQPAHATDSAFTSYNYVDDDGVATAQTNVEHGTIEVGDDFVCNDDGTTDGILFVNPNCDTTGILGIFSQVACRVENVFGTAMGLVYCSIYSAIMQPFVALLGLYVTIYGAAVVLGLKRATFRNATMHIMKMALVAGFVLSSTTTIQVGYKFYVQMTQTTAAILFESFDTVDDPVDGDPAIQDMVRAGYLVGSGSDTGRTQVASSEYWMTHLDGTLNRIVNFFVQGGVGFIMVLLGLLIFAPPLFAVVVYLIYSCIKMLVQAIIGYLMAVLGISFLFAMAPIFISFALFKVTYGYFENWLRYLATFTLQMFVIFTLLMFVVAVDLVGFFQSIGGLITSYKHMFSFGFIHIGLDVKSLCRVERQGDPTGKTGEIIYYRFALDGQPSGDTTGNRYDGFPKCIEPYTYEEVSTGARTLPNLTFADQGELMAMLDLIRENWEERGLPKEPANSREVLQALIDQENANLHYPFMELMGTADLMAFLLVRFLAVAVLTFLLEQFSKEAPALAVRLAGSPRGHGRLGGGRNTDGLGLQDDATFEQVQSDGWVTYKGYYKDHKVNAFMQGRAARTAHLEASKGQGFMRRHAVGAGKGMLAHGGGLLNNRARRVMGVGPVMASGAHAMISRSLQTSAQLGRKPSYDRAMQTSVQNYTRYDGDYFHAGKPLDDGNLGHHPRGRGHRGGHGHGGPRRHQRGK